MQEVVQFNENHKWCGCFGFVDERKRVKDESGKDVLRLKIGVPAPQQGIAYIFATYEEVDFIGCTNLVLKKEE